MASVIEKVEEFRNKYGRGVTWRVKRHARVVQDYINDDESVLFAFAAQKNDSFKEIFNTFVVCLTNKRIILGHKRVLWGSFFYSVTPELYNDTTIYRGLIWGKVTIDTVKEVIVLTNIPKKSLDDIETTISKFMMEQKAKGKEDTPELL